MGLNSTTSTIDLLKSSTAQSPTIIASTPCYLLPGLESIGCVRLLLGPVDFGKPAASESSLFQLPAPYQTVQILIPSGAWLGGEAASELTVSVFTLPALPINMSVPGAIGGPAIFLQPLNFAPAKPIQVVLPCNQSLQNASNIASVYSFDAGGGSWIQSLAKDVEYANGTCRVNVQFLSVLVSSWVSSADNSASKATAVIYGSVIGSAFVVFLTSLAVLFRYRFHLKTFKPIENNASVLTGDAAELVYNIRAELRKNSVAGLELQDAEWSGPDIQTLDNAAVASDLIYKIGKELRRRSAVRQGPRQISAPSAMFEDKLELFSRNTTEVEEESDSLQTQVSFGEIVYGPRDVGSTVDSGAPLLDAISGAGRLEDVARSEWSLEQYLVLIEIESD